MKKITLLIMMILVCNIAFADNPVLNYFKKWVDETRIENAIGKLLLDQFVGDLSPEYSVKEDKALTQKFMGFLEKCGIKNNGGMEIKVMVIESSIPDEILLPGGILILTRGYLQYASAPEQEDFILARNAFLVFQKQPLAIIKHEGIYPKFLDCIKLKEAKRSTDNIRELLRTYLSIVGKMKHKKADVQGALITKNPDKTRLGAIELFRRFTIKVWPPSPFDTIDLPSRIAELKSIKLPEQNL